MSYDSVTQYRSAMAQSYADSHPPIMSYVWHLCLSVVSGPQSLLVLHLILLVAGIFVWQLNLVSSRFSLLVPAMFFLPWIINFAGVLWKDVGMAFSLLIASGLLFNPERRRGLALLGLPFLFYAFAVRHNAILATAPLLFLASMFHLRRPSVILGFLIAVVTSVAFWGFSNVVSYHVLKAERKHYETLLMGDEIAKISAETRQNLLPWIKQADLDACTQFPILYERALCFIDRGYDPSGSLVSSQSFEVTHKLWRETVLANPWLSIKMRWEAFLHFLRSPQMTPAYVWQPEIMQNDMEISLFRPELARSLENYVMSSQSGIASELFKPYTWLVLVFVMLAAATRMRPSSEKMQVIALNLSALGYFASLLAAVPSVDFRYAYWCIVACSLSMIVMAAGIRNSRSRAGSR
ncbi:hypothetical protein [Cupriavidus sp. U2]|uniref:hypothetical protein n=1 Tax=Cupriavidus sp. U2 TaxID=2920269 RepID=UPI00129EE9E8|nr:hypothetical protein [Cupriavidus sp. U2]